MCDFKPGDEVVCVNARWLGGAPPLVEGRKYTVSDVRPSPPNAVRPPGVWGSGAEVSLEEVIHPDIHFFFDAGFDASRFRKVKRRSGEAGMAILSSICDDPEGVVIEEEEA